MFQILYLVSFMNVITIILTSHLKASIDFITWTTRTFLSAESPIELGRAVFCAVISESTRRTFLSKNEKHWIKIFYMNLKKYTILSFNPWYILSNTFAGFSIKYVITATLNRISNLKHKLNCLLQFENNWRRRRRQKYYSKK